MKTHLKFLALLSSLLLVAISSMTIHPDIRREGEILMGVLFCVFLASIAGIFWLGRKGR